MRGFSIGVLRRSRAYLARHQTRPVLGAFSLTLMGFLTAWVLLHMFTVMAIDPPVTCDFWEAYVFRGYTLADGYLFLYAVFLATWLVFAFYQSLTETVFQFLLVACFIVSMEGYFAAATNQGGPYGERLVERTWEFQKDRIIFAEDVDGNVVYPVTGYRSCLAEPKSN